MMAGGMAPAGAVAPPDLPSLLLNARICYIGMSLVPAVTELVVAELLYLGYEQAEKPAYVYIHSAGSMGKDFETPALAQEKVRSEILELPEDTLICPGHGPLTTVGEERAHNPFF